MPLGAYSDLTGTVVAKVAHSDLPGTVSDGRGPYDLTGTVSRSLLDSWEARSLFYRPRVELGGTAIPADDLVAVSVNENDLDSHTATMGFSVRGKRWSPMLTEKTFARTPVRIFLDHGREGAVVEPSSPDYFGYVIGCDQGGGQYEPEIAVQVGDAASLYEKTDSCLEIAPDARYTDGEIIAILCADSGIPLAPGTPQGGEYRKPIQAVNKRVFDVLKPFCERKGWRLRFNSAGQLEIYTPAIKAPPLPADWKWTGTDLIGPPKLIPPENSPSRWVLTANTVVDVNELGQVTETTTAEIEALYAPLIAVSQQQTDGTTSATGLPSEPQALRVISRIVDTVVKQGGQPILQRTSDSGWKNLRAARLVSNGSGSGGGYNFLQVYIDDGGNYVQFTKERFLPIGERVVTFTYNGNGDLVAQRVTTSRWRLTEQGVRAVGTSAAATTEIDSYVHGDDQSYAERVEQWGLDEEQQITFNYSSAGPLLTTTQDEYRFRNPRTRVDGSTHAGWFVLYSGEAQDGVRATWRKTQTVLEANIISLDSGLKGVTISTSEWNAREKKDGPNNFGTYKSNAEIQAFQLVKVENKQFRIINEDQWEQITYAADGSRTSQIFLGRAPTTRYKSSSWTRLLSQPIEVVVDDPLALAWFGAERETLQSEFIQDADEALLVIRDRRKRAMAPKCEFTRCEHPAKRGDTVDLSIPEHGISGRWIITDRQRNWSSIMPTATYTLERWAA